MSLLSNLATDESIKNETDSVGGGGPVETALYPAEVSLAFVKKSAGGALGLNLHLKLDNGHEHRETLWVQSGDAKGNKNFYENAQGEKKYLPGFMTANSLTLLGIGKEISQLDTEEKVVKLYSLDAKADVDTKVDMVMDLIGARIIVGLQKQIVDKNQKGDDGVYRPTGETREINEIDKFFREKDKLTTAEIRAGAEEPAFYNTWDQKMTGKTRNKASAANDANGAQGAPVVQGAFGSSAGTTKKPTSSLFG